MKLRVCCVHFSSGALAVRSPWHHWQARPRHAAMRFRRLVRPPCTATPGDLPRLVAAALPHADDTLFHMHSYVEFG